MQGIITCNWLKRCVFNSAYGSIGNEYFRFYDIRQATAITTSGQLSIRWIEKKINQYLNKILNSNKDYIVASDTDSIYIVFDELVRQTIKKQNHSASTKSIIAFLDKVCENKIQPFINDSYDELYRYTNAYSQKMIMKREALADKGIWTAKKRYVMNVYNNEGVEYAKPEPKVMGLEMIKSSTPSACKDKLWEALDIILNKSEAELIDFIQDFKAKFRKQNPADIAFPRGVNGLDKYSRVDKGIPIHVRGSLLYNKLVAMKKLDKKYQLIKEGEKIKFIYLKEPNTVKSNIISFPQTIPEEFDLTKYIDYDIQFEKSFVEPLKIILDSIGWKTEKTSSLEAFFS